MAKDIEIKHDRQSRDWLDAVKFTMQLDISIFELHEGKHKSLHVAVQSDYTAPSNLHRATGLLFPKHSILIRFPRTTN